MSKIKEIMIQESERAILSGDTRQFDLAAYIKLQEIKTNMMILDREERKQKENKKFLERFTEQEIEHYGEVADRNYQKVLNNIE